MRLAYADPPYPGNAKKHYGAEAREVNFPLLITHLQEFDGWALSCGSRDLQQLLPFCPSGVRVGAWVKSLIFYKPNVSPAYGWEPVLFVPARKNQMTRAYNTPVDWCRANATTEQGVIGAKPEEFCFWIFRILGASAVADSLDDLFPGSGAVSQAWRKFCGQQVLALEAGD
jgi:hypothetical protein